MDVRCPSTRGILEPVKPDRNLSLLSNIPYQRATWLTTGRLPCYSANLNNYQNRSQSKFSVAGFRSRRCQSSILYSQHSLAAGCLSSSLVSFTLSSPSQFRFTFPVSCRCDCALCSLSRDYVPSKYRYGFSLNSQLRNPHSYSHPHFCLFARTHRAVIMLHQPIEVEQIPP